MAKPAASAAAVNPGNLPIDPLEDDLGEYDEKDEIPSSQVTAWSEFLMLGILRARG